MHNEIFLVELFLLDKPSWTLHINMIINIINKSIQNSEACLQEP